MSASQPTEDERSFLYAMRLNGGTTHADMYWPEGNGQDHYNETLLALYEDGFVYPDERGWWGMTARGNMVAQAASLSRKGSRA